MTDDCCDSSDYAPHVCTECEYQHCHCEGGTPGPTGIGDLEREVREAILADLVRYGWVSLPARAVADDLTPVVVRLIEEHREAVVQPHIAHGANLLIRAEKAEAAIVRVRALCDEAARGERARKGDGGIHYDALSDALGPLAALDGTS